MEKTVILLGSNLGDRKALILKAKDLLEAKVGKCIQYSSVYESQAWGFKSENTFLNQVLIFETTLNPEEILNFALHIESELGRIRLDESYNSRTIDVDILFYGDKIIETPTLQIPHPKLHIRRFTLIPLDEIMPDFIHPILNKTIRQILLNCTDTLYANKLDF